MGPFDIEYHFDKLKERMQHRGSYITSFDNNEPLMISSPKVLVLFMQSLEDRFVGGQVVKRIMYNAGAFATERMTKVILKDEKVTRENGCLYYINDLYLRGWGEMVVESDKYNFNERSFTVAMPLTVFSEHYGNVGGTVCHYYAGLFAGMMTGFSEEKAECRETKCVSNGDNCCLFEIKKKASRLTTS